MTLVRSGGADDTRDLRSQAGALEAGLADRSAEVATVKSALDAFKITYRQQVGLLHEQLDELERAISEAEIGALAGRTEDAARGPSDSPPAEASEPAPRYTSDAVRKLFRDVAKAVHPDLALDELAKNRRHALMIEANSAYALGDEEQLRWILEAWERSPEAVRGDDPDATRERLVRRIAQLEEQLDELAGELSALKESPLWRLKVMVDDAAARGKDLVRDMVARLKRDILVATNRLDAIRPPR